MHDEHPVQRWHALARARDASGLDSLLADDAVFHSPVVRTPQRGRAVTRQYLAAAFDVLLNDSFRYVRELISERDALLEFEVVLDGVEVNGIDLIRWSDDGLIEDFKVMIRPLKAIEIVHQRMGERLARQP